MSTYRDGRGLLGNVQTKVNAILAQFTTKEITHGWGPGTTPDHNNLRCFDFMVPDIATGNKVANYLIKNKKKYGIIGIIWNRRVMGFPSNGSGYRGPEGKWRAYNGPSPHTDHLHVEFNNKPMTGKAPVSNVDGIARAVIRGDYGNGAERKRRLKAAGHDYNTVQARVRELMGVAPASPGRYRVTTRALPLNGRAGPGTGYRVTMTARKGYVLDITEIRNGWARSTGGHWYSMKHLTKV